MEKDYSIFDNMIEGCQIIGPDWQYLYVNDAAARQNRIKKEDLLGRKVMEVYPGIEKTDLFFRFQKCMSERVSASMENEFTFFPGDNAWFEIRIEPVPEGIFILSVDITERKKMEEKNRKIIESMAENYIELDNEWRYKDMNKRIEQAIGKKKEELIGKRPYDVFPVLKGSTLCEKLKEAREKNKPLSFEVQIPINRQWVKIHVYPSNDGITMYSHDITEHKKAGEILKESEERYYNLFKNNHAVMILIDPDNGDIVDANPAACSFYGYSKDKLLKMKITDINILKDEQIFEEIQKARSGKQNHFVFKHKLANDNIRDVDVYTGSIAIKGKVLLYSIIHDITKQIEAEEELKKAHDRLEEQVKERTAELEEAYNGLKESEEKFRGIFDNAKDMISLNLMNEDKTPGRFIEVNEVGIKRLGYNKDEFLKMTPQDIILPEGQTQKITEALLEKGHAQSEHIDMAKNGSKIPVDVNLHLFKLKGKNVTLSISRDISERKKGEEEINRYKDQLEELVKKLRESEAHFKSLSENSPDLIVRVDKELNYLYVNPTVMEITGKPSEYFIGKNIGEMEVPDEYRVLWKEEYQKTFEAGKIQHMEYEFPVMGGLKSFERITVPEFNDEGEIETVLSISRDITERKQAGEALHDKENELQLIMDAVPALIAYVDSNCRYRWVNKGYKRWFGYTTEEIQGRYLWEVLGEEVWQPVRHYVKQVLAGKLATYEQKLLFQEGGPRWVHTTYMPDLDKSGNIRGFVVHTVDISERKQAEEKLFREKAFSDSAINSMPGAFYLFSKDGKFLRWNQNLEEVSEYSSEEISAMNPLDFFGPEEKEIVAEAINQTFNEGKSSVEANLVSKSGMKVPYYFTGLCMPLDNTPYLIGEGMDISERKKVEEELKGLVEELKRSNDELQRFAYIASHDLQEPLRTISSFTQLLERRYHDKLDSDADEFIEYVVKAAQRMQQMIHDLLDYSRIMTKGKEFEEVSTENILQEVMKSLKTIMDENNAVITHDPLPLIVADKGQIRRVFQNLILNALKFKKPDEPPRVHISCQKNEENNEYIFSVADNGIGIEKQYFDRIFTIFQRLHTLDEYHGTGIGLSVVKRIIDRHGGCIWVESEPGAGSTFYFTILFRI